VAEKSKPVKRPGAPARGSQTGRPIMVLLDVLGQRWSLRILWELREGPLTFRALQARCEDASPTIVNARLKALRDLALVEHDGEGYRYTPSGRQLAAQLAKLDVWANEVWSKTLAKQK
jgi:DNA-binding HxlR family transcriptional regulator